MSRGSSVMYVPRCQPTIHCCFCKHPAAPKHQASAMQLALRAMPSRCTHAASCMGCHIAYCCPLAHSAATACLAAAAAAAAAAWIPSGPGLAGLLLAALGANVVLTDIAKVLPLIQDNVDHNQLGREHRWVHQSTTENWHVPYTRDCTPPPALRHRLTPHPKIPSCHLCT
jgi:hypothetical protein